MDLPILMGRLRQLLWFNLADTLLAVGTLAIGAMVGVEAAAGSRMVWGLGWFAIYAGWMHKLVGFSWPVMRRIYLGSAGVALLTALPALYSIYVWRTPATLGFTGLVIASLASGCAWLIGIFLLRHPAREDLVSTASHAIEPLRQRWRMRTA